MRVDFFGRAFELRNIPSTERSVIFNLTRLIIKEKRINLWTRITEVWTNLVFLGKANGQNNDDVIYSNVTGLLPTQNYAGELIPSERVNLDTFQLKFTFYLYTSQNWEKESLNLTWTDFVYTERLNLNYLKRKMRVLKILPSPTKRAHRLWCV